MNNQKEIIMSKILNDNLDNIYEDVENYLKEYPYDIDIIMVKGYLLLLEEKFEEAVSTLEFCHSKIPFDADVYYLLGMAYRYQGELLKAVECLDHAYYIKEYYKQDYLFFNSDICRQDKEDIIKEYVENVSEDNVLTARNELNYLQYKEDNNFWLFMDIVRNRKKVLGSKVWMSKNDKRYCGYYNTSDSFFFSKDNDIGSLLQLKGEILPVLYEGADFKINLDEEFLLPVASEEPAFARITINEEKSIDVDQGLEKHFNYYKLKGNIRVQSNKDLVVAKPIKLGHSNNRKKLVLSLFVDGLAQQVIDEVGLENLMPYTYKFFSKGMRFSNTFASSDWTYPSLASFLTGLEVPDHMMVKPDLTVGIPDSAKTIFEYMKEAGYYTAMISGDWRSCITDGYAKGLDRYVVQHQNTGMRTEDAVQNAITHMEAFSDTDQYIWLATGDLHDIADGYDMPLSIQTHMSLDERVLEEKGETSVKQEYSINKRSKYIRYAAQIDLYLRELYDYIEAHYSDDEFVVSLFADHGQKYLTKPEEHHLSRSHSNVAFMTRGGGYTGVSDEFISIVDYNAIMCKLAGASRNEGTDAGILPKTFGGDRSHDFVVTETIHQGDPYMAAIRNDKYTFYFTSENNFDVYGRIEWGGYTTSLETSDGMPVEDDNLTEYYIKWIENHLRYLISY